MMASSRERVVVVGAGQAAAWAVRTLRKESFAGEIVLVGVEPHPPYERPPLSKAVLTGEAAPESTHLVSAAALQELDVVFTPGRRAEALDRTAGTVTLDDGQSLAYDQLLLTTGARPRRLGLPGEDQAPVLYLRDIEDCLAIRAALQPGRRVIVIGGGLIGLEVAGAAGTLGCAVTVIEAGDRLMARVVGPEISAHFARLHADHGATLVTAVLPERFETAGDGVRVVCRDGSCFDGDLVVVGIGVVPNAELAAAAGLTVDNGIRVDDRGRTDDPRIFAAGDVTNHDNPLLGRRLRLETWQNAQNQAVAVAKAMCGQDVSYAEVPWGWSDQLGANLQILGAPEAWNAPVTRGAPDSGSFSVFYLGDGRIEAVNAVNAPRDIAVARRLMAGNVAVDPAQLADVDVPLRKLLG